MELANKYKEYSEFELEKLMVKMKGEELHTECGAVGTAEETLNIRSVTKKYKGVEAKSRTKGAGSGELKISLHMNYEMYKQAFGMNQQGLIKGVTAYGRKSTHPEFSMTALVLDEDGIEKLVAYPRCIIKTEPSSKIENGSEDVPEIEMTVALMPDGYDNCKYEALAGDIPEEIAAKWLESFEPDMVMAPEESIPEV